MARKRKQPIQDFFISYTASDKRWATWVAEVLESEDHTTMIQAWDFKVGGNFVRDMEEALELCRCTVLIYSPEYFKSVYAQAEWRAAFTKDPTGEKGLLLPIRVASCEPPRLLRPLVYVDLVDLDNPEEARGKVLLAARPRQASARLSSGFPGAKARIQRTLLDVARDLQDVLNTTRITFIAQVNARNRLYTAIRRRLKSKDQLEYEEFFHEHFRRLNEVELRQHAIIRDYTKNVLYDYNQRALKLGDELRNFRHHHRFDIEDEAPHLVDLHEHLTVWLSKYKATIRMPSTCLVYVGPNEGMDFPTKVDREVEYLVAHLSGRPPRKSRGDDDAGEGLEGS
ncbi:MAG TPA: toll/interleukin-1 receptor domain-containing protein [Povalibacter sp.]